MISNKSNKDSSILGVASVNEKGQVVIPVSAREAINLKAGDKLLVIAHPSHEGVVLVKPDGLEQYATRMLEQLSEARNAFHGDKDA